MFVENAGTVENIALFYRSQEKASQHSNILKKRDCIALGWS